jgi:hypothetical protein
MERIGKQQQASYEIGIGCGGEARLAASVGAATQKGTPRELVFHQRYRATQPFLIILGGGRRRRTVRAALAIRQVTPQNVDGGVGKFLG